LQQANRVLPNSDAEARLLGRTFSMRDGLGEKTDIVSNGIDATLYVNDPAPSRAFLERYGVRDFVLQVGTISPVKNQLRLIEALFDVPVPLVFVGHTPSFATSYAHECRVRANARGNVHFVDHVAPGELPGIYALAAVHVLPSWRETPGLVSLEAAACGCRIVTTRVGSAHEYFGDLAWYCDPADVRSIRSAAVAALKTPASDALRRHVLANFTWRRAGEATLSSYSRLLCES
jgi:glycosyltransferase involved in cell wall biosynthesis